MDRLYVYADFDYLEKPMLVGELGSESIRGAQSYSFKYSPEWLKQNAGIIASDGSCALKVDGTVRSTSRWTLTGKKIVFAETMPDPDMSYDCEVKSLTANTMELVRYMEIGDDYADTMRLICRKR